MEPEKQRNPNMFEHILFVIGVIAVGVGYFFVHTVIVRYGLFTFESAVTLLVWFSLIILIILTAVSENSKEELKIIIRQQHDEIKFLRNDIKRKK